MLQDTGFAQKVNELLCKFIAHNITVLIREIYEIGIEANCLSEVKMGLTKQRREWEKYLINDKEWMNLG
jgi:hypothetical protein